ncbi:MAG: RNA polymerase sigma factor RpoD/SigA [Candidatus Hydrogenedentes bacterium]|nr:RNA polymerase sigma factor RpoD/SigA [Candidatus Hydrogenedentota bacterium]
MADKDFLQSNVLLEKGLVAYISQISKIPLLAPEEEKRLAQRIKRGDGKARKKLILSNLRLVVSIAKRYMNYGLPLLDLIEEGNIGLMKAVDTFDPSRGTRFSTYATWWIRQTITRALSNQSRTVRIPVYMSETLLRYKKAVEEFYVRTGHQPSVKEIAEELGVTEHEAEQLKEYLECMVAVDFAQYVPEAEDSMYLNKSESHLKSDSFVEGLEKEQDLEFLLSLLPERDANVLKYRYGLMDGKPHTLVETGRKFNLTRERVRQIERNAINFLRNYVESHKDDFIP